MKRATRGKTGTAYTIPHIFYPYKLKKSSSLLQISWKWKIDFGQREQRWMVGWLTRVKRRDRIQVYVVHPFNQWGIELKWNEISTAKKVLFVISLLCMVAYFVLFLLDILEVWVLSEGLAYSFLAFFLLIQGFLQKSKKAAICLYISAAIWVLLTILNIFVW